jgi:hypothetical protein
MRGLVPGIRRMRLLIGPPLTQASLLRSPFSPHAKTHGEREPEAVPWCAMAAVSSKASAYGAAPSENAVAPWGEPAIGRRAHGGRRVGRGEVEVTGPRHDTGTRPCHDAGLHQDRNRTLPRIDCLHTAPSNIAVFDRALREAGLSGVDLRHWVRADLLAAAAQAGGLTPAIARETADALADLCADADAVLLTCSTLGPAVEEIAAGAPVLRTDAALARDAVRGGGRVVVLCAAETTLEPTRRLFEQAARGTAATLVVRLIPGAWDAFLRGDENRYPAMIAQAAGEALRDGAARVALAQASVAGAVALCAAPDRVLASPAAGLRAAVRAAAARGLA